MRRVALAPTCLLLALAPLVGQASASSPTSPMLLSSTPEAGGTGSKAPKEVSFTFSEPLDRAYSRIEVYDECGRRVDQGQITVTANEMSTKIVKRPAGRYKIYYFANAIPKGATGETDGVITFTAKKGSSC